jgi:hypothetical protein
LDINKIFGQFDSSSNNGRFDNKSFNYYNPRTLPSVDEDHPRYFVRMFWKIITNYLSYGKQLTNFFDATDSSIPMQEIEYIGEKMMYARAYSFIEKVDINDKYHQKVLKKENYEKLIMAYKMSIEFYENEEEYEKCALLKKQLDFIKFLS